MKFDEPFVENELKREIAQWFPTGGIDPTTHHTMSGRSITGFMMIDIVGLHFFKIIIKIIIINNNNKKIIIKKVKQIK